MENHDKETALCGLFDCYAITKRRDKAFIVSFLDRFMPLREEVSDNYQFPFFSSDPQFFFSTADGMISFMEKFPFEDFSIYWANQDKDSDLANVMCYYTRDGFLILGGSCRRRLVRRESRDIDMTFVNTFLQELKDFAQTEYGYITLEEPPGDSESEFLDCCQIFETEEYQFNIRHI